VALKATTVSLPLLRLRLLPLLCGTLSSEEVDPFDPLEKPF